MSTSTLFHSVLDRFRKYSFSEQDKGYRFERLVQAYLQTDPQYASLFSNVWLWGEFPGREQFGGTDTGIDIVTRTENGDYWAVQCKCYQENSSIGKPSVDSFLSTSSRTFTDENGKTIGFAHRLWVSTTNHWGKNAEETIKNQNPPVSRIGLTQLAEAPVDWGGLEDGLTGEEARTAKKTLRKHQTEALTATHQHFQNNDRGKLIMACGTGKTYASLKIAEHETGGKGLILFLVPSIALLGQTLREWSAEAENPINAICICSDSHVSKKKSKNEDTDSYSVTDLALPASTDVKKIVSQFLDIQQTAKKDRMTVVFSTYQSIEVISEAQAALLKAQKGIDNPFGVFDLVICDEAHRTTGVTLADTDGSSFVKVHDNGFLQATKRLYMTATPRLYGDDAKSKAAQSDAVLCSMDDPAIYGEEIYRIGFGKAVEDGLLTDYKVLILTMSDEDMPAAIQNAIAGSDNEISTDDASKLIGCINALSKQMLGDAGIIKDSDPEPMRRAVAFCQNIKVSKSITENFNMVSDSYAETLPEKKRKGIVSIQSDHIDGSMPAVLRDEKLYWLKTNTDEGTCRVLTNVRCLSEGVDVPSLDAVLFLSARNSQVDVVQSVGRVMRKSPGKKYGYIIIPIVVPSNVPPSEALSDNDRYRVVWTVLNALRAHDDRFNATINKIELNKNKPTQVLIGKPDNGNHDGSDTRSSDGSESARVSEQMALQFEQLQGALFAKMVEKVGDRRYWEQWAKDVAQIAERQIERITYLINKGGTHKKAFDGFLAGLQENINPSISQEQAIEMFSQHIITKPVFEALFEGYSFVKNNPVSMAMQNMLAILESETIDKDAEVLQNFYESVRKRASGIDNAEGKQRIIIELYDKFFKTAFPKMVERLGIVYTPVEVVDFIIHSVNDVLKQEFGRTLSDENIHILDPFTGTGTFMTRLLQSGLIKPGDAPRKYAHELHANEIVLLAYYIAAVNIENAYHDLLGGEASYESFQGICLTDTFQLGENREGEQLFSEIFPQNSERVLAQKKAPLRVIIGNPPYSGGQKSANDNAQNQKYENLDARIANTYAQATEATNKNSLYNSYIKAFRWSTDRLDKENGGVIGFITNGIWLDNTSMDGFRKYIESEFSKIYVFNLRGGIRGKSGDIARREGKNIFDILTGVSITILVKRPSDTAKKAQILYHDIGDYLERNEKLSIINDFKSVSNPLMHWQVIKPNTDGDWVNQRNDNFSSYTPIGDKKNKNNDSTVFVSLYSNGIKTNRDAWVYNFSFKKLSSNINDTIKFFNEQSIKYKQAQLNKPSLIVEDFIDSNPTKISWSRALRDDIRKNKTYKYDSSYIIHGSYRPFCKQNIYLNKEVVNDLARIPILFPSASVKNLVICISGDVRNSFSTLISDHVPDLSFVPASQCFPLYYFEERKKSAPTLFDVQGDSEYIRRDGISDFIFKRAQKIYGNRVTKEDIFYYVYSILHSPDYCTEFANDLKKMLPHIPMVEESRDFWKFSKAGRALADLHINYEQVPPAEGVVVKGAEKGNFKVNKLKFIKKGEQDIIIYNSTIRIENIPAKAYEYIVNGKSAIEWIMDRYQVKVDKASGIKNDPNDWSEEVGNPRYILDLLLSIINVSLQTVAIIESLPKLEFGD